MKATCFCFTLMLGLISMGCKDQARDEAIDELKSATALTIGYLTQKQPKSLKIDDRKEVAGILATIHIERVEKGAQVGLIPKGKVDFGLPDGTVIKACFVRSAWLDRSHWGQIYLKNDKFYRRICEAVSKAEGRPIDVLV